jgi:hypothetical protein
VQSSVSVQWQPPIVILTATTHIKEDSRGNMDADDTVCLIPRQSFFGSDNGSLTQMTFVINLTSLVTPLPLLKLPLLPGLSLTISKSRNRFSSTPTFVAILANRLYVSFRVSLTTFSSKKSVCCLNNSPLKSQNFSGATFKTAAPASCVKVDEGCQGWICWRNITCSLGWYFSMIMGAMDL